MAETLRLLVWALAALYLLHRGEPQSSQNGQSARCRANRPLLEQIQVTSAVPPKFTVVVTNKCPMCPVINVHVKCGGFSKKLVDPKVFQVLDYDDCVVNSGLPLAPLQKISFNYTHNKFVMSLKTWSFQCE